MVFSAPEHYYERNRYIFLVYFVDETEPFRPKDVRMLTTSTAKVKGYLEDQILRGNIQYGEQFSSVSQLSEFREDWPNKPKSLINDKLRYAAITAAVDGKVQENFKLRNMYNELVYGPLNSEERAKKVFLVYSVRDRNAEVNLFTTDPKKVRSYLEDMIKAGVIHYGNFRSTAKQLNEFMTDWESKPKSYINDKLKGCAMAAVIDGKVLDMFSLS